MQIPKRTQDQPADGQAKVLEQAAHFAVAAFAQNHLVPVVGAFAALLEIC